MTTTDDVPDQRDETPSEDGLTVHHDWRGRQTLAYTILDAIASVRGCTPTDLAPLTEVLDVDALERLFEPTEAVEPPEPTETTRTAGTARSAESPDARTGVETIQFTYERCHVAVDRDGLVEVTPLG